MPAEVKQLGVTVKKALTFPLMLVSLYSPNDTFDNNFVSNYANINIVDAISRIRGVGQVNLFGGSDYAMRIWIQPDRLARANLTVADVRNAVKAQSVVSPGGALGGLTQIVVSSAVELRRSFIGPEPQTVRIFLMPLQSSPGAVYSNPQIVFFTGRELGCVQYPTGLFFIVK